METIGDDDWACFLDHDAMFTTPYWYHQIEEIIRQYPDAGIFTVMTNRIGNPHQKYTEGDSETNHDIYLHRKIGLKLQAKYGNSVSSLTNSQLISGVVIIIQKKVWKEIGGFKSGLLGVDNDIHEKCKARGFKVLLMKGVYVYHWYRGDGNTSHLS